MKTFSLFSTDLKNTLEEIVNGYHNDAKCKEYQEYYESKHGKTPPPCKFKDHPELIPNLLEKVIIDSDGQVKEPKREGLRAKLKRFFKGK